LNYLFFEKRTLKKKISKNQEEIFDMLKNNRGWLANSQRKARQKKSLAFTDKDVEDLIKEIDSLPELSATIRDIKLDRSLRSRDKTFISLDGFGSRTNEILSVKRKDISNFGNLQHSEEQ
jgi:integrase